MTDQPKLPLRHPAAMIATWFGAGRLPIMPGTWGSVAALPFAWVIHSLWGSVGMLMAAGVVFIVGLWASKILADSMGQKDPGEIVVDEVVGMWITVALVTPNLSLYVIGFVLFRVFDIFKPWPAGWADRKVKGGPGVMLDDVLAALYSGGAVFALFYWKVI
ncbi:MAG: phosphatidylglycerophosphatase A [Alphaproteobacteria bacterium]|nr:phosphatidylglycerophosphatase A [Alphaproteobacteria bacterium]